MSAGAPAPGAALPARRHGGALLLKAAFSAGLPVWLGLRIDWGEALGALRGVGWRPPLLCWLAMLAALALWPLRLQGLLRVQDVRSFAASREWPG